MAIRRSIEGKYNPPKNYSTSNRTEVLLNNLSYDDYEMRNDKQTHKFRHKIDINGIIVIVIKVQGQNRNFVSQFSSFPAVGTRNSLLSFIVLLSGSLTSLSPWSSCSEGEGNERFDCGGETRWKG